MTCTPGGEDGAGSYEKRGSSSKPEVRTKKQTKIISLKHSSTGFLTSESREASKHTLLIHSLCFNYNVIVSTFYVIFLIERGEEVKNI